ncbi:JAB domain-containing protein [Sphingomonas sp.]|uniref:JAB domain-containing protein n=1 Tax=Sphingomonas sp. TaxID=28214 RepID=UPI0035AF0A08
MPACVAVRTALVHYGRACTCTPRRDPAGQGVPPPPRLFLPDAAQILRRGLADARFELVAIGYFDPQWRLLALRHVAGHADGVHLPIRRIARDALLFGAAAVMLAHNHPDGDPRPSMADLRYTRRLAIGLDTLDIRLAEHWIVTAHAITSLRDEGLL